MGVIDLSAYKPTPTTLGDANQIRNGFTALEALLNGNVDNNNFGAGKIFDPAKVMQNAAVDGDGLVWDNTNSKWVPASAMPAASAKPGVYKVWDSVDAGVTLPTSLIDTGVLTIRADAKHMKIFAYSRDTGAAAYVRFGIRFNNDSAANYYPSQAEFNSSNAFAGSSSGAISSGIQACVTVGSAASDANTFGSAEISIPHAFNTVNYKECTGTYHANATGAAAYTGIVGGRWIGAAAINRVQFLAGSATWAAGTRFTIYVWS